jgi:L-threonylcarbamoyladenylate synthase
MTSSKTAPEITTALAVLREGGLAAIPTDTLYALAADATDAAAIDRVFAVKGREGGKPLPLFVSGLAMAETIGVITETARVLAGRFWPGALTLVVQKQPSFHSDALAGGDTVALRAPANEIALALLEDLGRPITGTSANLSGDADPVTAEEVRRQLGDCVDYVLDAGPCAIGVSSTIVDCTQDGLVILRQGSLSEGEIRAALATALR